MLALLAIAALATTPPAAPVAPQPRTVLDLPAPASLQRADVLAWTSRYVHGADWTLLAYDYEGVKLIGPMGVKRTPDGFLEADVRTELFRPITLKAGVTARSGIAHWNVDCDEGLLAVRNMTVYAGNNLEGALAERTTDGQLWQEPVGSEAEAIKGVCKAIAR
jgi:hypothetical protein